MAIFSRRTLQRLIYENEEFLTRKQTREHVDDLNRAGEKAIGTEWEVVGLNALSKVGKVDHERNFGGPKNPDVYFESKDDAEFQFVADITAASDKGIEKQYSLEPLLRAFQKKFEDNGVSPNHVYLDGGGNAEQVFKREDKAQLPWMPGEFRYEQVFFKDKGFVRFLEAVKGNPKEFRQYRFDEPIDLTVSYNPHQTSAGMTHFDYKQANLIQRNPVFNALQLKYEQLKDSGYSGLRGIILCDGGSDLFHHMEGDFGPTYGVDQIVRHFLKLDNVKEVIGFVITITVVSLQRGRYSLPRIKDPSPRYAVALKLHVSESGQIAKQKLELLIEKLRDKFPAAVTHAANAIAWNKSDLRHEGGSFEGGLSVGGNEIKLSARFVLELLAGRKQFHDVDDVTAERTSSSNPFEEKLNSGRLIEKVTVQSFADEDDDYITFVFGEPDPAVSKFKSR